MAGDAPGLLRQWDDVRAVVLDAEVAQVAAGVVIGVVAEREVGAAERNAQQADSGAAIFDAEERLHQCGALIGVQAMANEPGG